MNQNKASEEGKNLAKEIFFECTKCNGPLVPTSQCIICKKADQRSCVSCGIQRDFHNGHDLCKKLIYFTNKQF